MMGTSHALSGVFVGLLVGQAIGLDTVVEVLPFAVTTAGYALLPDLDHPSATVSRSLGWATGRLSWGMRKFSGWLYRHTKGPRDENCAGTHRHASHTLLGAALVGGAAAGATVAWGTWAVVVVLGFGLMLAVDRLGKPALIGFGVGAAGWLTTAATSHAELGSILIAALGQSSGWLGIAVALGCFTHCLGDSLTLAGCPWAFPLPIAGETWYELRPPRWLRFRAGGSVEKFGVFPALVVATILALPGVWTHTVAAITQAAAA